MLVSQVGFDKTIVSLVVSFILILMSPRSMSHVNLTKLPRHRAKFRSHICTRIQPNKKEISLYSLVRYTTIMKDAFLCEFYAHLTSCRLPEGIGQNCRWSP